MESLWEANTISHRGTHMSSRFTSPAQALGKSLLGHVSKSALLTRLLPLSCLSFFGAMSAAATFSPDGYDWRVRVISKLTSPDENPEGYLLPSIGIMAAIVLALPFAGYVSQRLHTIAPGFARSTGVAFAIGFVLMLFAMATQLAEPVVGMPWLHTPLAQAAGGFFVGGMLGCSLCALKDRLRIFGGEGALPRALSAYWIGITLLPVGLLALLGMLMFLGHQAGQAWAEDFRQSFRNTVFWRLAFWEWVGTVIAFAFLWGSVLLLPGSAEEREARVGHWSRGKCEQQPQFSDSI